MDTTLDYLKKTILRCKKCPNIVKTRSRPVPGYGSSKSKILFVGLAPGKDGADLTGIPFTRDPSGLLIDEMCRVSGISRELDVFITNLVKCNPQDSKGRNRPPSKTEIKSCEPYLKQEIKELHPKMIVPLGKSASNFFINQPSKSMTELHGQIYDYEGITLIPFIHPGFVIRGAYDRQKYLTEFEKVGETYFDLIEKEKRLSRFDLLLMILKNAESRNNQSQIVGKTRLQKYVFLAQEGLQNKGYKGKYAFRPYYYGPFNRQLYTDIEWLKMNKLIEEQSNFTRGGFISTYNLTEKGHQEILEKIKTKQFLDVEEDIAKSLSNYKDYTVGKLVEYVHQEFTKYNLKQNNSNESVAVITTLDSFLKKEKEI